MPSLFESQRAMARSIANPRASGGASPVFAGAAPRIERGLAVYRANVNAAAAKALAAAYPVILQVVGPEFFDALAREHRRAFPSTSGDLDEYGATFAAFLADFPHVSHLAYLPDLARLEWRVHEARAAADGRAWDATTIGEVASQRQDAIRITWAPGTAIVESQFPIARLWTLHQDDHEGEFTIDWSVAERALVARDGFAVTVQFLDEGEAAFLGAALDGGTLGHAATVALSRSPAFDLGRLLARAIAMNFLCGFTLEGTST